MRQGEKFTVSSIKQVNELSTRNRPVNSCVINTFGHFLRTDWFKSVKARIGIIGALHQKRPKCRVATSPLGLLSVIVSERKSIGESAEIKNEPPSLSAPPPLQLLKKELLKRGLAERFSLRRGASWRRRRRRRRRQPTKGIAPFVLRHWVIHRLTLSSTLNYTTP